MLNETELREKFSAHWAEHGEVLSQKYYKGKKGKGGKVNPNKARKAVENTLGITRIYSGVLSEIIGTMVEEQTNKRIMMVTDLVLNDFNNAEKDTVGIMQYYYWPKLILDNPLSFEVKENKNWDVEKAFNARCEQMRQTQRTYEDSDTLKSEGQRLSMDILTSINGKPSEEHTQRSVWVEVEDLHPPEVKDAVLASEIGALTELNFMDGEDEVNVHVKVYAVNDIIRKDLDDEDLYISSGSESKADFKSKFTAQYDGNKEQSEKGQCYNDLTKLIMTSASMDNIPNAWLTSNVNSFVDRHISSQGGDIKKAMQVLNVDTEAKMRDLFEMQVYKETVQQMATMWYADEFDCPVDPQSIATDMHSRVIWVD